MAATSKHSPLAPPWVDKVEPHSSSCDEDEVLLPCSCYSKLLKADLLPGTFVVLRNDEDNNCDRSPTVARIVKPVGTAVHPFQAVEVNIFRHISKVGGLGEVILYPHGLGGNNLRYILEIVQTSEVRKISMVDVRKLAFVFTEEALNDSENLFSVCQ
jgi:hypothetical protein